jgi:L-fuconolactonase
MSSAVIDSHAHLVTPDVERYPPAPLTGTLDPGALANSMTIEGLIAAMDEAGVTRAVLVQRGHVYGYDNRYVSESAARDPARFTAVCGVASETAGVRGQVSALLAAPGNAGIRFAAPGKVDGTAWFAGPLAIEAWEEVAARGGSVCVHFFRWNRDAGVAALIPLLERFPDLPVVLDHAGNPTLEDPDFGLDAVAPLERYPNLYVKVSPINFGQLAAGGQAPAAFVERVVARFGASRVMWGSDVAQSRGRYADFVAAAQAATSGLSEGDRAWVLGGTAEHVYFNPTA